MKTGIELIAEERQRQIKIKGHTAEHDAEQSVNSRTCLGCSYCEPILYPKEGKKKLKCWGKSNLTTITDINEICDTWQPK